MGSNERTAGRGEGARKRLGERRERHRKRSRPFRILFALGGFLVLVGGLAMLILPGPGLIVIIVGLGMLAMEFQWAEALLDRAIDRATQATSAASRFPLWVRISAIALALVTAVGGVVAVWRYDIPYLPL